MNFVRRINMLPVNANQMQRLVDTHMPFRTRRAGPGQMLKRERRRLTRLLHILLRRVGVVRGDEYVIETLVGPLRVTPYGDWIACRFEDVGRAREWLPHGNSDRLNRHSGKWNFHFGRVTAREAFEQFIAELQVVRSFTQEYRLDCNGRNVLATKTREEDGQTTYRVYVNDCEIKSDHPEFPLMVQGAIGNGWAGPLLDWIDEHDS